MKILCWLLAVPTRASLMPPVIHRRRVVSRALSTGMCLGFDIMAVAVVSLHIWRARLGHTAHLGADEVMQGTRIATVTLTGFAIVLAMFCLSIAFTIYVCGRMFGSGPTNNSTALFFQPGTFVKPENIRKDHTADAMAKEEFNESQGFPEHRLPRFVSVILALLAVAGVCRVAWDCWHRNVGVH